jgi:hypothetical protein
MTTYYARHVDTRELEGDARERRFEVVFDVTVGVPGEGVEPGWSRRRVVVPLANDVVTAFWSRASAWRPSPEWASFFAATRHEVLEALVESGEESVELERSDRLEDHLPPADAEGEPWPPSSLRVALAQPLAGARDVAPERGLSGLLPDLSEAQEGRIPAVLAITGGAFLLIVALGKTSDLGFPGALAYGAAYLAVGMITGLIGFLIAAKALGSGFGYLRPALVKLVAVVTLPAALDGLISLIPGMGWPAWGASICLTFVLLSWLFDLDTTEVGITVLAIFFVRMLVWFGLVAMLW